jgi:signal transduction histidine kinase/FixJ family two-component response regulator
MSEASVLIVDDDRSILRLCQRLLERASFKVYASTDPNEAIHLMDLYKMDLLLSDIRMPVMDGFELISRAKQVQPDIAVLVMTGFGTVETAIQALHKGVDGLILKPFENTTELVSAVERVLTASRERKDAARAHALRPLFDVSETLLSENDPQVLETLIMNAMQEIYQSNCFGVFSHTGEDYQLMMARGVESKCETADWCTLSDFMTRSEDPAWVSVSGLGNADIQAILRGLSWSSLMVVPVIHEPVRFVFFTTRDEGSAAFSESDLEMFTILARQATVALENSRLYTDLRSSLRRVEESQFALVQAEKMAAVGRLMASLAHEINNPLQAVRNCLHLANRPDVSDAQRSSYLAMTDSELDRLVKTVRHMLDFYRPGKREKEFVDLATALDKVLHLLKAQLDHQNIECFVTIPTDCPQIFAVRDQIQQIFFNLLLNSMDAMEFMVQSKFLWIDVMSDNDNVCIRMEDSGPGISQEMQGKLFEPFNSTKKNGTGLGLAVSYGVVEAHGGQLRLAPSHHGSGACFEILFPLEKRL